MTRTVTTRVGPGPIYYLSIDGTSTADSRRFGAYLQQRGWTSILSYLSPAADGGAGTIRLVDPAHPYLSIHEMDTTLDGETYGVSTVCPTGLDGKGAESFQSGDGDIDESCKFIRELLLAPQVALRTGQAVDGCALSDRRLGRRAAVAVADLLYVSSHGYFCGLMVGDGSPERLFSVAKAAADQRGFEGPLWIVLSQCSTLNSAIAASWAAILSRSKPGVRGILGYEDKSPNADATVGIIDGLVSHLDNTEQPMSLLAAWQKANAGVKWSAIVHNDAVNDRLGDIPALRHRPLDAASANYRLYTRQSPGGASIVNTVPPFELKLESGVYEAVLKNDALPTINGATPQYEEKLTDYREVLPETLDEDFAYLYGRRAYRLTVAAPAGTTITEALIELINLRREQHFQPTWSQLFASLPPFKASYSGWNSRRLRVRPVSRTSTIVLPLASADIMFKSFARASLHWGHYFLWFAVTLQTDGGSKLHHEFRTKGWLL